MPAAVSMIPVLFDLRRILCCAYHISDAVSRAFSRSSALHLLRYLNDSNKRVPYCAVHIISRRNLEKRTQERPFSVCVNLKKDTPRRSKGKKNILIKEWFISCQASPILLLKSQINYFYSSALYRRSIVHWGGLPIQTEETQHPSRLPLRREDLHSTTDWPAARDMYERFGERDAGSISSGRICEC